MSLLSTSTLQHLRFAFSWLLLPVYVFALSTVSGNIDWTHALLLGFILHYLLYPASNGYNSYEDKDTESIGGIAQPKPVTRELYWVSLAMDTMAILLALFLKSGSVWGIALYVLFSRLYSYRKVRLKKYPIVGYLTVVFHQGPLVFWLTWYNASTGYLSWPPVILLIVAALLIGAFYPITQIYQHRQDKADGVHTLSALLGIKGTFLYSALLYFIAFGLLGAYYVSRSEGPTWIWVMACFAPVILIYLRWWRQCLNDPTAANFQHTMKMSWIAATCANLAFSTLIMLSGFG